MFRAYCSRNSITEHLMSSFLVLCVQGPLFLYLAYQSVHEPLQVPQRYMEQYKDIRDKHRRTYAGNAASIDRPISADRKISAVRHPQTGRYIRTETDRQMHSDRDRQTSQNTQIHTDRQSGMYRKADVQIQARRHKVRNRHASHVHTFT